MPVEIMGQVYEQFLGKVISINANHRAVIEEKPEVRKAGDVYYTPSYIVEYIVKNTLGKLVEGKTPRQVSKLRILDPACGSGSFLIGAYDYLLEWHRRWYVDDGADKHAKLLYEGPNGEWQLKGAEKKRILLNNIYGVDIDPQAVEVTKLSLLLKVLEGETDESVNSQLTFFKERALPDLDNNIKWGNSLIGPDFYKDQQATFFSEDQFFRINVFDWRTGFPSIMESGGFDAIVGNPPYVRIHNLVDYYPEEVRYIQRTYATAEYGKIDIYIAFVEKCSALLNSKGMLGFIVSSRFLQTDYGQGVRQLLREKKLLAEIVDFDCAQVFEKASTYTCLLFASGYARDTFVGAFNTRNDPPQHFLSTAPREQQSTLVLPDTPWSLTYSGEASILKKLEEKGTPLPNVTDLMLTGVKTGANSVFTFELVANGESTSRVRPEGKDFDVVLESDLLRPYSKSESLKRYSHSPGNRMLLYPYAVEGEKTKLIPERVLRRDYPHAWEYLTTNRRVLEQRQKGKLKGSNWYGLSFASSLRMFTSGKLVTPTLATVNSFSFQGEQVRDSSLGPGRVSLCHKPPYVNPRHPLATFGCLAYQRREELRIVETPAHAEERSAANGVAERGHQADEQGHGVCLGLWLNEPHDIPGEAAVRCIRKLGPRSVVEKRCGDIYWSISLFPRPAPPFGQHPNQPWHHLVETGATLHRLTSIQLLHRVSD